MSVNEEDWEDVEEEYTEPCEEFELDTEGEFGYCMCGFHKEDHGVEFVGEDEDETEEPVEEPVKRVKEKEACLKFRLDTGADAFGLCKCGWPNEAHKEKKINPAKKALGKLKIKNHQKSTQLDLIAAVGKDDIVNTKACGKYRVDTEAKRFGDCKCGFPKADHDVLEENPAAAALRKLKEKNKKNNQLEDDLASRDPNVRNAALKRKKEMEMEEERLKKELESPSPSKGNDENEKKK